MKNTPFDLPGRVAVVTGSSRGIGRASAELMANLGAKVVISSRKADACHEVAEAIKQAGGDVPAGEPPALGAAASNQWALSEGRIISVPARNLRLSPQGCVSARIP